MLETELSKWVNQQMTIKPEMQSLNEDVFLHTTKTAEDNGSVTTIHWNQAHILI